MGMMMRRDGSANRAHLIDSLTREAGDVPINARDLSSEVNANEERACDQISSTILAKEVLGMLRTKARIWLQRPLR